MDQLLFDIDCGNDPLAGFEIDVSAAGTSVTANSVVTNNRAKINRAVLTIFPPDQSDHWLIPETYFTDIAAVSGWCAQFEHAPTTGLLHVQAYVEFKRAKRMRFDSLRKLIEKACGKHPNIQPTKRATAIARQCSINYCLKDSDEDGTRVTGTDPFIWPKSEFPIAFCQTTWDERPKRIKDNKKNARDDKLEEQRLHIESRPKHWTYEAIVHESDESKALLFSCASGKKYHESRNADQPRRLIQNVVILYGAGGTGKSTMAREWDTHDGESKYERYYKRNPDDGVFWGGGKTAYKGQRVLHFEEFDGNFCAFSRFKDWTELGTEGPNVNVKQGGIDLNHETVVITSNHHPASWYRGLFEKDPKQFFPFQRRITKVLFFPEHRPDGTDNLPTSADEYHFIDQTSEWKSDCKKWEAAKDHAARYWPMVEPDQYDPSTSTVSAPRFN